MSEFESSSTFFRPAIIIALSCATVALLAFTSSELSISELRGSGVVKTTNFARGKQDTVSGCATLYGSKYDQFPDTIAHTFCSDKNLDKFDIDALGFGPDGENKGISYVETGFSTWVSLYSEPNAGGESLVIEPLSKVWLWKTYLKNGGKPWNDEVKSIYIEHRNVKGIFPVQGLSKPNANCALLYSSNPIWTPTATALHVCANPDLDKSPTFIYADFLFAGHKIDKLGGTGVSNIRTGENVALIANDGEFFNGEHEIKVEKDSEKELSLIELRPNVRWGDHVKSIKLIFY